jgi:hypothetical protein
VEIGDTDAKLEEEFDNVVVLEVDPPRSEDDDLIVPGEFDIA